MVDPGYAASYPQLATGRSRGPSAGKLLAVVGVVIALVVGAFVAWQFLLPRGGAGSPEEAAEQLVLAAASQDAVGVIDMVSPAEVEGLDDVYGAARDRAEEEDLVSGDGITDALSLELTDLEFEVDELGDGYAKVTLVDGKYDASWDPEKLPERLDFLAEESDAESESGDIEELFDGEEPYLTTVEIDGRWYVTVLGSYAEAVYTEVGENEDLDDPDYDAVGEDVEPVVGEDPEEVVENIVDAVNSGDMDELLANFPEDLGRPLRPYVPLIEDAFDGRYGDAVDLEVSADDLDLETEELDDGRLKVVVERASFSGSAYEDGDEDYGRLTIDGRCAYGEDEYGGDEFCLGQEEVLGDLGIEDFYVVLREVDGGYQLDPVATASEYAAGAVDGLTGDLLEDLLEQWEDEL